MAKAINRSPSKASPSKRPETSTSIVTPPKKVKKGKSKIVPVKQKIRKTPSSLLKRQSSSSSLSFSSSSLPASSSSSSKSFPADLPATTAQSCSNRTTPPTKKKNDAYLQLSLRVKTDNFEVSSKIKLQHYEIDWFNPEVISYECNKYLKSKDSLPNNHENQLKFLLEKFEPAQIKISFSNAIGKIGNTATKLYYPLPMRKDKIVSSFIQLILSTMMYSRRRTSM